MKKLTLFFLLFIAVISQTIAQESTEKPVFDYAETKHEFSLDIAPIINGHYPSNLLYRQHYISKKGNNVAFRLGADLFANVASTENTGSVSEAIDRNSQGINVYIGKEWQKQIHPRIIGYYGADFNLGYSRSSFSADAITSNQLDITNKDYSYSVGTTGFLGMRYHFSKHFSASAETGANLRFHSFTYESNINGDLSTKSQNNSLRFGMIPLRAIRFAFHF
jgi:hypothetical protein